MEAKITEISENLEGISELIPKISIPYTVPGDTVFFFIKKNKRKKRLEIQKIEKSNSFAREKPECKYFEQCGGCKAQHIEYKLQFKIKTENIKNEYMKLIKNQSQIFEIPSEKIHYYRNRMDFIVDQNLIGLRKLKDYRTLIDIDECFIQNPVANLILKEIRNLIFEFEKKNPHIIFNRKINQGILKYLTIRTGINGYIILTIVEKNKNESYDRFILEFIKLLNEFYKKNKYFFSLRECYIDEKSEISNTENGKKLSGEDFFKIRFGDLIFDVPPDSFFQPNPEMISHMLDNLIDYLLNQTDFKHHNYAFYDLYCGTGNIALYIFNKIYKNITSIYGYEINKNAVTIASRNFLNFLKQKNQNIEIKFFNEDLNQKLEFNCNRKSIIFLDPPRSGLHKPMLQWILENQNQIEWILYLSCNPSQQLKEIKNNFQNFEIQKIIFGDPFPHTPHWESLILLRNKLYC